MPMALPPALPNHSADAVARVTRRLLLFTCLGTPVTALSVLYLFRRGHLSLEAAVAAGTVALVTLLASQIVWSAAVVRRAQEDSRRSAEETRRLHERFVRAVQGSSDGLWDWDVTSGEVYFSPRWLNMLGYGENELPHSFETWKSLIHPDELERCLRAVDDYQHGRTALYEVEHRLRHKDGTYRWVLTRGALLRDAAGAPLRMSGSHTDIHERKLAEEALKESEARFRQVTDNIREVFWLSDVKKDEVIYVSPGYELIWGRSVSSLKDSPFDWLEAIHPEDRQRVVAAATSRQATGEYDEVYRILRPDGTIRWIRDRAFPVKDETGKVYRIAGLAEDVTERRRLDEELRAARDAALASARAKSAFLANVSHELRTPLNAVIGMNELMLETSADETQRERAAVARDAGRGLLSLIDDLLDFSRLEAGRLTLDPAPFDPRALVAGVERLFRQRAQEKGLALTATVAPEVPAALHGDAGRLRQILLNFVGNAVKFTESGSVAVEADCPRVGDGAALLRLRVRDTGPGVSPAARSSLFNAFSQGDATVTRRHGGAGLGLAICRQIAELMGGEVGVDSEPGRGSSFRFEASFPLAAALPSPAAPSCRADARGVSVLVVEDNPVNRRVILSQLEQLGCPAQTAENGAVALDRLTRERYDLVLMDCAMPVLDGYAATAALRRREGAGPRTPVIALTAGARAEDRARCLEAGMDDHLAKPVSLDQLAAALSRWGGAVDPGTLERAREAVGAEAARWQAAYLADARRLLGVMGAAAAGGDDEALRRAAHTLKGASAALGARRLADLCARVEAGAALDAGALERELSRVEARLAA
ncbi:MAG: PAS domain-containing protein [Elusimicrobiota bacterium]|nr:PAS domain-containing protein [Elusimicrobiota bacterium]